MQIFRALIVLGTSCNVGYCDVYRVFEQPTLLFVKILNNSTFVYIKLDDIPHNFLVLHTTESPIILSSYVLFCSTSTSKSKHIQFTVKYDKEEQEIHTFKRLQLENVSHFFIIFIWKMLETVIKIVVDYLSDDGLINLSCNCFSSEVFQN